MKNNMWHECKITCFNKKQEELTGDSYYISTPYIDFKEELGKMYLIPQ